MTREELNDYNIYMLRELARRSGVKSPTSKKKEQLIDEILSLKEGTQQPSLKKSKQGRPPKNVGLSFVDFFNLVQSNENITFSQHTSCPDGENYFEISGYVERNGELNFVWQKSFDRFVQHPLPKAIADSFDLVSGDYVEAILENREGKTLISNIQAVNGLEAIPGQKYYVTYYDDSAKEPDVPIKFLDKNLMSFEIKYGQNVYIYEQNSNENTKAIMNMFENCPDEKKIYINLTLTERNRMYLKKLNNCEMFTCDITENFDYAKSLLNLAIKRAMRKYELGQNVIIIIDDVNSLLGIDDENMTLTKKLLSLTKDGYDCGSITTFAIMTQKLQLFERLADTRLIVSDGNVVNQ